MKNLKFLLVLVAVVMLLFMLSGCDSSSNGNSSKDYSKEPTPGAGKIKVLGMRVTGLANYKTKAGFFTEKDEVCLPNGTKVIFKGEGIDGWQGAWNATAAVNSLFVVENGQIDDAFGVPFEFSIDEFEGFSITSTAINGTDGIAVIWDIEAPFVRNRVRYNDTKSEFVWPAKVTNLGKLSNTGSGIVLADSNDYKNINIAPDGVVGDANYIIVGEVKAAGSQNVEVEFWRATANGTKLTAAAADAWWDTNKLTLTSGAPSTHTDWIIKENVSQYAYDWTWKLEKVSK